MTKAEGPIVDWVKIVEEARGTSQTPDSLNDLAYALSRSSKGQGAILRLVHKNEEELRAVVDRVVREGLPERERDKLKVTVRLNTFDPARITPDASVYGFPPEVEETPAFKLALFLQKLPEEAGQIAIIADVTSTATSWEKLKP